MILINLSVELTQKLVEFAVTELSLIEAEADEMYAPNGPVYWSRDNTRDLLRLLEDEQTKVYGEENGVVLYLTKSQADILHTLIEVYAQEELGWSDTDCEITLAALAASR